MFFIFKILVLFLVLSVNFNKIIALNDAPSCNKPDGTERLDCYPEYGSNEKDCVNRGCCWSPPSNPNIDISNYKIDEPYCYYPNNFLTYQVVDGGLKSDNSGHSYTLRKNSTGFRPNEILKLEASIIFETDKRLRGMIIIVLNLAYLVVFTGIKPLVRLKKVTFEAIFTKLISVLMDFKKIFIQIIQILKKMA